MRLSAALILSHAEVSQCQQENMHTYPCLDPVLPRILMVVEGSLWPKVQCSRSALSKCVTHVIVFWRGSRCGMHVVNIH